MEQEIYESWNQKAQDWDIQVGDLGDRNRILNSDPVLWQFLGDVNERTLLDAGCGTGYLARQLCRKGAIVTGVDLSSEMLAIAEQKAQSEGLSIDFREESCSELKTLPSDYFDLLVSNYVLMDLPDLEEAILAFHRVLKPGGISVLVFSHPCFDQGAVVVNDDRSVTYHWKESYFGRQKRQDPAWKHFTTPFIWFHRPLSDYWKAFRLAGFDVIDFEEPRLTRDRANLAKTEQELFKRQNLPYSVAFKLLKSF
ncbi:MAG: class I SAM-dependent methyltransferase [Plectolyngbya sp. WJT66-NPBG17]|jgi:ubiquinone/menaquinone biosynthesis C-methylase UbiE|nr:class I SAM-dependent methyltransferase [Plectolyngbya sp. WJT66-NPBG17]MBW4524448.1 class I SAM-dependent methyltransferase [Phormidium tanganyikae FI6-MK23]